LEIDTYDKILRFYQLIEACQNEKKEFGLTNDEKKSILQLATETLNLTEKQREELKEIGMDFYDATN
jgi:hypothetical protein